MARMRCDDSISRRQILATLGGAMCAPLLAAAQGQQGAPTVISNPPRDFSPGAAPTTYFADPDVLTIDPAFGGLVQPNAAIVRLWTGALWAEGPAWNSQGRYLLWSDIPSNRQYRWMEDDGHVSVFRSPSNFSNGNTFDPQGRQIAWRARTRRALTDRPGIRFSSSPPTTGIRSPAARSHRNATEHPGIEVRRRHPPGLENPKSPRSAAGAGRTAQVHRRWPQKQPS